MKKIGYICLFLVFSCCTAIQAQSYALYQFNEQDRWSLSADTSLVSKVQVHTVGAFIMGVPKRFNFTMYVQGDNTGFVEVLALPAYTFNFKDSSFLMVSVGAGFESGRKTPRFSGYLYGTFGQFTGQFFYERGTGAGWTDMYSAYLQYKIPWGKLKGLSVGGYSQKLTCHGLRLSVSYGPFTVWSAIGATKFGAASLSSLQYTF
jgi:hypothetical protein